MNGTQEQIKSDKYPNRWKQGQSGNPAGRPANPEKRQLLNALRAAARDHENVEFLHHVAKKAYEKDNVMLAVLDKIVPDATLPKERDDESFVKQLIIIRPEESKTETVSRPVHIQQKPISRDVEFVGDRENDVIDISGHAIQRADSGQSGSDIS